MGTPELARQRVGEIGRSRHGPWVRMRLAHPKKEGRARSVIEAE